MQIQGLDADTSFWALTFYKNSKAIMQEHTRWEMTFPPLSGVVSWPIIYFVT